MWQNLEFSISIRIFDWKRFQVGWPDFRRYPGEIRGPEAVWLTLGPLDIGIGWGA